MRFKKGSPEAMEYMKKLRERKTHLKLVNTAEIDVPKNLLYIDNNGIERVINTLTPKNNISRRNGEKVFKIGVSNDNDFHIKNAGTSRSSFSNSAIKEMQNKHIDYKNKSFDYRYDNNLMAMGTLNAKENKTKSEIKRLERLLNSEKRQRNEMKILENKMNLYKTNKE